MTIDNKINNMCLKSVNKVRQQKVLAVCSLLWFLNKNIFEDLKKPIGFYADLCKIKEKTDTSLAWLISQSYQLEIFLLGLKFPWSNILSNRLHIDSSTKWY